MGFLEQIQDVYNTRDKLWYFKCCFQTIRNV